METGRPPAAPATPPRGGDTLHVILSGAARRHRLPGAALSPRPPRGAAGRGGGGGRAARSGPPTVPPGPGRREEGGGGGGARLRPRGERHRHLFARLSPARRARSGSASCRPGGRRPALRPRSSSFRSSSLCGAPHRPGWPGQGAGVPGSSCSPKTHHPILATRGT